MPPKLTDMERLKNKKKQAIDCIVRIYRYVQEHKNDEQNVKNFESLSVRKSTLIDNFDKLQDLQADILSLDKHYDNPLDEIEELYYECLAEINLLLPRPGTLAMPQSRPQFIDNTLQFQNDPEFIPDVNLDRLNIPTFDGTLTEFKPFIDLFSALVDRNTRKTNVEKLCHLKLHLKGEPLSLINNLPTVNSSYPDALALLNERYNNESMLISHYIHNILDIPIVQKCTAPALRDFISKIKQQLGALKNMNQPVDSWDMILICILSKKLDQFTNRAYQIDRDNSKLPTVKDFISYIENRATALEAVNPQESQPKTKEKPHIHLTTEIERNKIFEIKCSYCSLTNHKLFNCKKFRAISIQDRISFVDRNKLCKLCLNNHSGRCRMTFKCSKCQRNHNVLLHLDSRTSEGDHRVVTFGSVDNMSTENVLLPTAIIQVKGCDNNFVMARCLIDTGSQINLVTSNLVKKLNLRTFNNNLSVIGISQNSTEIHKSVNLKIKSCTYDYDFDAKCSIVDKITHNLPQTNFDFSSLKIPKNISLSDTNFNKSSPIDILLSANIFFKILLSEKIETENLIYQNTLLGYIVSGLIPNSQKVCHLTALTCSPNMENIISKFWEIEKVPEIFKEYNNEQEACENMFKNSIEIIGNKFQVKLPLKQDIEDLNLGDSFSVALKRFENLEKRFKSSPELFIRYKKFIDEYLELNHARIFDLKSYDFNRGSVYFMAHHPVIRDDKKTTKLRVVFDGSMKSKDKKCINDFLYNGAVVQNELFAILVLFRTYKYVILSDIKQMYRIILIHPDHLSLQNILWREPNGPLLCLQLQTVTYGLKSSSFLATRCLVELANTEGKDFPLASQALLNNTYVDDILGGHDTLEGVIELKNQLISLLQKRSFELHKWCSNNQDILKDIPREKQNFDDVDISKSNFVVKTLGLSYDTATDNFNMRSPSVLDINLIITKRQVLSFISQFYDPLGLAGPVVVTAKIFMQKIWLTKIKWDDILPKNLLDEWQYFLSNFLEMPTLSISRNIYFTDAECIEIVGYCDASTIAYGAVIYARTISSERVYVNLICSKSRVVPIDKKLTIPRLELNAALLLSNLCAKVYDILKFKINKVFLYSDSNIVLAWINSIPVKLNPYVANRILKIHELTSKFKWLYVSTKENPADMLSRGLQPQDIKSNKIWFHGPGMLSNKNYIHSETLIPIISPLPETKIVCSLKKQEKLFFEKFSSISKIERIVAYMLRFYNCLKNKIKPSDFLTISELDKSLNIIIKCEQAQHFAEEIKCLQSKLPIKNSFNSLSPFLDFDEILRVGGRLQNAKISYNQKHPIILPKNSHITNLIIRREHLKLLHAGPRQVLSSLNLKYWIINGNREVKKIIHKCVTCFKHKAKCSEQLMGSLPEQRVCSSRVFQNVGVDFCGPFLIKQSRLRKSIESKAYIALFICFSVKAIHMELLSDLTTETFVACFKRFINRRGKPSNVFCDNGSTFKGANNQITDMFSNIYKNQKEIMYFCLEEKIKFNFIPSYSPVFGGLWEAGVKSAKFHLKRVMGDIRLTYEELNTLAIQIEGILNSRPLMPMSNDSTDLEYLTPGHFLIGAPITSFPEYDLTDIPQNRLKFWKLCVKMQQHFWQRWHKDYLAQLQSRPKWRIEQSNLKKGMLVLLKEDNVPSYKWPVGRIVRVVPGRDNRVRVCEVRTKTGCYLRSITKIAVLPII